jgi:hypothetical protein
MADSRFSDGSSPGRYSTRGTWKIGDRVLAPWEPMFLYAGTVEEVTPERALIEFDDGDSGWVELNQVQPLRVRIGQKVMSRRRMGPHFFFGEIREVEGENLQIEFDDGKEEQTTIASVRIPCEPTGRGAEHIQMKSHIAFHEHLGEGDRVWALWNQNALFPGTVHERQENEVHVHFDDGDEGWIPIGQMIPLDLVVGMFVMGRWRMGPQFYPGTVTDTEGDRVHIRYDDGHEEWTTAAALALPLQPPPGTNTASPPPASVRPIANAPPTIIQQGWNPTLVIAIGALFVVAVAAVFYFLGAR